MGGKGGRGGLVKKRRPSWANTGRGEGGVVPKNEGFLPNWGSWWGKRQKDHAETEKKSAEAVGRLEIKAKITIDELKMKTPLGW